MAYNFHNDQEKYFEIQRLGAEHSLLPFLREHAELKSGMRVLEIGSHFGGNIRPFVKEGCICTGVEIVGSAAEKAKENFKDEIESGLVTIVHSDIYDVTVDDLGGPFDLIFLKDSIEHIPDQEKLIAHIHQYLSREGSVFFAFPPWWMPFGGHQQGAKSFIISKGAWLHLLPRKIWSALIRKLGETEEFHDYVMSCKDTGINIERFEKAVKASELEVSHRQAYLVAPIYKFKFGLPEVKLPGFLAKIPFLRNFYISSVYYILKRK